MTEDRAALIERGNFLLKQEEWELLHAVPPELAYHTTKVETVRALLAALRDGPAEAQAELQRLREAHEALRQRYAESLQGAANLVKQSEAEVVALQAKVTEAFDDAVRREGEAVKLRAEVVTLRAQLAAPACWLVELGSAPPSYWTGRVEGSQHWSIDPNNAMRFARHEDAEGARCHLVPNGFREGSKSVEHLWSMTAPVVPLAELEALSQAFKSAWDRPDAAGMELLGCIQRFSRLIAAHRPKE